jgi:hypothetical protein
MKMSKTKLQKAYDMLDDYEKENPNYSMLMLSIEMDSKNQPHSRGMRCIGPIPVTLGAITLLRRMLEELEEDLLSQVEDIGAMSERFTEMLEQEMGITDMQDPRIKELLDNLNENEKSELKDFIKQFRKKFGK